MKISALFLAGVCSLSPAFCAPQSAAPIVHLKLSTKVEVHTTLMSPFVGDAGSDSSGNVYARLYGDGEAGTHEYDALPIRKIAPDGTVVKTFRVLEAFQDVALGKQADVTGQRDVLGVGTFVTPEGRLFLLAVSGGGTFVVEFAQDGSVRSKTRLETERYMQPWRLAVFRSGEYLVTGITGKEHLTPFTGVFTAKGQLVKKIYEPEDEEARLHSTLADRGFHPWNVTYGRDFIYMGEVAAGSDGNIYLLHGANSMGLVYVISPAGDVVRKLRIDAGDPEMVTRSIRSYAGRLAIEFEKHVGDNVQNLIKLTDLRGGSITDYSVDPVGKDLMFLAGYGPQGLIFKPAADEDKKLYLVTAKLP